LGPEDLFFNKHESLHRTLMDGMTNQQKKVIKTLQQQTVQTVEQWKKESDMKIATMEKRLTTSITSNNKATKVVNLTYVQLAVIMLVCILLGRFLQPWGFRV
jgi:uncharacterized protein (UPF0262 family)